MKRFVTVVIAVAVLGLGAIAWFALRGGPDNAGGHPSTWTAATRQKADDAYQAALFHLQSNDMVKAKVILDTMLREFPQSPQAHELHGRVLMMHEKKLPEAYAAYTRSLELDPAQAEVHFPAAICAEGMGDLERARYHYTQASTLAPSDARYPLYLGQVLLKLNDLDAAQLQVLRALQLDSSLAAGYALLAEVAARRGKWDMAIDAATKAYQQTDPDNPKRLNYVLLKAQYLRRNAQPEVALEMLRQLPPSYQIHKAVVPHIADSYLMMSQPAEAAQVWSDLFMLEPTNVAAAAQSGLCWLRAGEVTKAKMMLDLGNRVNASEPLMQALDEAVAKARAAG